jgi:5-methylcytosine-specific restriction endonuclease McrA
MPFGTGTQLVPWNKGVSKYNGTDHRSVRRYREQDAPGLTYAQRMALLHAWVAQRRACTYCPRLASTIDHVIPLYRGGTNHEGNLTPCCKPCNSSKRDRYIIEWKTGRMAPSHTPRQRIERKPKAKRKPKPIITHTCTRCGAPFTGHKRMYCGDGCMAANNAQAARDRYRIRVGIPLDAPIR